MNRQRPRLEARACDPRSADDGQAISFLEMGRQTLIHRANSITIGPVLALLIAKRSDTGPDSLETRVRISEWYPKYSARAVARAP